MGRHESFDPTNAIPFSLETSGETLPAPGSPEALAAFGAACRAVDAASRLSDVEMEALTVAPGGPSLWTSDKATEALCGNYSRFMPNEIEAARATPRSRLEDLQILALRRELRMAEAARSSRIRELHALVYGDEPDPADEDEAPAAAESDPIFAAINEGKRLLHVSAEVYRLPDLGLDPLPEKEDASEALYTHVNDVLLKTVPRTAAGCAALVKFAQTFRESEGISLCEGNEALVSLIARSPACRSPAPAPMADPRLVAMVAEWQDVRRKLNDPATLDDPEADALADAHSLRQREIYLYPARTPLDLLAKVPALRDELEDAMRGADGGTVTNDLPISAWTGLLADIERIAGATTALADDAELIALGHAFDAATIRHREACDALDAADNRAEPHMPERPACLLLRVEDAPFNLRQLHCHPEALQEQPVTVDDIEWMTRRPAQHEVWVDDPNARPGWSMVPGKKPRIVHWPEAQARIDEIVAAWDAWHAEQDRVMDEAGVTEAQDIADEAGEAAAAIARQATALPARTLAGVWVKVRIAAFYGVADPTASTEEGYTGEAALRSLYRDAPRLMLDAETADIRIVPETVRADGADLPADIAADLLRDLEECDRMRAPLAFEEHDAPEGEALYHRQWDLLERIDALPPGSLSALRVKACAGLIALKWDEDASNTGTGSFLSLATQVVTEVAARPDLRLVRTQNSAPEA